MEFFVNDPFWFLFHKDCIQNWRKSGPKRILWQNLHSVFLSLCYFLFSKILQPWWTHAVDKNGEVNFLMENASSAWIRIRLTRFFYQNSLIWSFRLTDCWKKRWKIIIRVKKFSPQMHTKLTYEMNWSWVVADCLMLSSPSPMQFILYGWQICIHKEGTVWPNLSFKNQKEFW